LPATEFTPPSISDALSDARFSEALAALVREAVWERRRLSLRLQGDSMWPTILPGDLVDVEPVSAGEIQLGDVVIWERGGGFIAHRVVDRVGDNGDAWLVTKGDNSASADRLLASESVLGRVASTSRPGDLTLGRPVSQGRLEAGFWLLRWRVRSALGRASRVLPWPLRRSLRRWRDRLGRYLSLGFKAIFLR
jgi:signal peptidase I